MASEFESFAIGFLGETAKNINLRKDRADDYFERQMERASTRGADALAKRKERLNSLTTVANTLKTQAGMPEDVLKMVINEGPDTLAQVEAIYKAAAENGTELDEDFWRSVVDSSTEMKSDNESLGDFLGRTVGLFGGNLEASKTDGEGGDPFSAFVASGLGYNAMDKARANLDKEVVAEGFTAADLLAMEGRPEFDSPYGSQGVTVDTTEAVRELDAKGGAKPLSITEKSKLSEDFEKAARERVLESQDITRGGADGPVLDLEQAKAALATEYADLYGEEAISQIPGIAKYLSPDVAETPASVEATPQAEFIPNMQYKFNTEDGREVIGTFVRMDENGNPVVLVDGVEVPLDTSGVVQGDVETPAEEVAPTEEPDPQAQAIEQAVQPGGDPSNFSIKGDQIPQTLKLNGVQYWFQSIEDRGGKSFAIFVDENGNEQPVPISD